MKLTKKVRKRFVVESYCSCNSYCGKGAKSQQLSGSQGGMATQANTKGPCT